VPGTGKVYHHADQQRAPPPEQVDKANPRPQNEFGHIIEMTAPDGDHAAATFTWECLIKCGDPRVAEVGAMWNPATSADGWFACPDNCAIDALGRLWVATDQGSLWPKDRQGRWPLRRVDRRPVARQSKLFFRVPVGAEMCGPASRRRRDVLRAVHHPRPTGSGAGSRLGASRPFEDPATRWPDFKPDMPPRPSIVAIRKKGGGKIASG
jgi:secreted PhoX family phosphatase